MRYKPFYFRPLQFGHRYCFTSKVILVRGLKLMVWLSFLISLVPFLELRFAIPLAMIYNAGISPFFVFGICVILNILAIPIAYLLLDFIVPPVRRRVGLVDRLFKFSVKRAKKYQNLSLVGLALFVSIPLPVTGAYTGTLIAFVAGFDRAKSSAAIAAGVIMAGVIMWTLASVGLMFIRGITPS